MSNDDNSNYWNEHDPPMSFIPEKWTYLQKREFRGRCLPYLWSSECSVQPFGDVGDRYEGRSVLCVGEGSGIDALEFAMLGAASVHSVDASEKAVALMKRHIGEFRELPASAKNRAKDYVKLEASVADARKLPFLDESFDFVYCFGVLHHIPGAIAAVVEAHRVLRHGGTFMGMVYNRDSLLYAYSILARGFRNGLNGDEAMRAYSERNPGCPHSVAYTGTELRCLLAEGGFRASDAEISVEYDVIDLEHKRKVPFKIDTFSVSGESQPGWHIYGEDKLGWHLWFQVEK